MFDGSCRRAKPDADHALDADAATGDHVASAADAYQKIRAGACLVQLYTALVFAGPRLVTEIKKGLAELLRAEGYTSVAEAVGTGAPATQSSGFVRRVGTDAP